jgi:RNA polymerase sigma-70 factor (ECF subfamily)
MTDRETALVQLAMAGDAAAFGELAEGSRAWMLGLCRRLVGDPVAAEDLVQEALALAFRDLHQLRDLAHFRAWLSRIVTNRCRMHLRRLRALRETSLEEGETAPWPSLPEPPLGIDQVLAQLPPERRRLLALFYGEGLSHEEVGRLLSLSPQAVKSRLHRARELLRKELLAMMSDTEKQRLGAAEEAPWEPRTILLVEPEEALRETLRAGLTAAGYEVVVLPTGEAAIESARAGRGDLLILDKHCVTPHWLEVMALVQVDPWPPRRLPIIAIIDPIAGDPRHERDVLLAWQAGAAVCLTRPPEVDRLLGYIESLRAAGPEGG